MGKSGLVRRFLAERREGRYREGCIWGSVRPTPASSSLLTSNLALSAFSFVAYRTRIELRRQFQGVPVGCLFFESLFAHGFLHPAFTSLSSRFFNDSTDSTKKPVRREGPLITFLRTNQITQFPGRFAVEEPGDLAMQRLYEPGWVAMCATAFQNRRYRLGLCTA